MSPDAGAQPWPSGPSARAAGRATYAVFASQVIAVSSWASRLPQLRTRAHLNATGVGMVLTAVAAGGIIALPASGGVASLSAAPSDRRPSPST